MAVSKLTSKFIDVGNTGGSGGTFWGYDSGVKNTIGTLSETANGSSNVTSPNIYGSSTTISACYWQTFTSSNVFFILSGTKTNTAANWTQIRVNGTVFTRSSATYSTTLNTGYTTWYWSTSTNPFTATVGADNEFNVEFDGNLGHLMNGVPSSNLTANDSSTTTITVTNGTSTAKYLLRLTSGTTPGGWPSGTVVDSDHPSPFDLDIPTTYLPSAGSSATYQVQLSGGAADPTDNEAGLWLNTTGQQNSFTITRDSASDPDIDVTETSAREINPGASSFNMTFSNGTSGDEYQLRHYDGGAATGTIVNSTPATADGSGNFTISVGSTHLPASGTADTKWYSLYARRTIANGGSNLYFYCSGTTLVNTLNLTRRPSSPTLSLSDDDAASDTVGIIINVTDNNAGFDPDRLLLRQYRTGAQLGSQQTVTFTGDGNYSGTFTQPRNTGSDNYYYRVAVQKLGDGAPFTPEDELSGTSFFTWTPSNNGDYQAGYISPDLNIGFSRSPSGNLLAANIGDVDVNITGGGVNDTYRVVRTSPSTLDIGDTGILTGTTGSVTLEYATSGHLPPASTTYNYKIRGKRADSKGGTDVYADTNITFSITRDAPIATYSISAPTSINEGATGTVNVTTTNFPDGKLYWDVDQAADYATGDEEGDVDMVSNAGSFDLSPTADSATEGAETDTVRLYTDSNRTQEVANDSFTINDTSTGGGGSGGGSDGNSTYGLNVYGPDGSTIVFSSNLRSTNALVLASPTIAAGNSVSYTGIADATDASKIAVVINDTADASLFEQDTYTITRTTASGGTIQITNDLSTSRTPSISIYRIA